MNDRDGTRYVTAIVFSIAMCAMFAFLLVVFTNPDIIIVPLGR